LFAIKAQIRSKGLPFAVVKLAGPSDFGFITNLHSLKRNIFPLKGVKNIIMGEANIYQRVWSKYMPLIVLKLRSAINKNESQVLTIDKYDFENAAIRKNAAYSFNLEMKDGRAINNTASAALARDFALAMNENQVMKDMTRSGHFKFSMGNKFILTIQVKN
jgi:hypothetical protein